MKFNLSHTDGLVVCAVTREQEIGIDVENCDRQTDWLKMSSKVLAAPELSALRNLPDAEQRRRFFALWTLKEAYIKARGLGLAIPLDAFWFDMDGDAPRIGFSERCSDDAEAWRFVQAEPTPQHRLAVAVNSGSERPIAVKLRRSVPFA